MWKREGVRPLRAALVVLAAVLWALTAIAAQFTADMVETRGKTTKTSTLSVMGHRYAIQFEEQGQRGKVTVDQVKNVTRIFMPSDKKFIKMRSDSMQSLMNDPIQAFREAAKRYTIAKAGTETVGGYLCDKLVVSSQGKDLMTEWVAKDLKFPVKIVTHGQSPWTMELKNIRRGAVSPALFKVPPGYAKVDKMKAAEKKNAGEKKRAAPEKGLTSSIEGKVPIGLRIGPGGQLRVAVSGEGAVKVYLKNLVAGESVAEVLPFRDGKRVESIGTRPTNLKGRFDTWDREFNSPSTLKMSSSFRVDAVLVKVEKGLVLARVEQAGGQRREYFNAGGTSTWIKADPSRPLNVRITGADQDGRKSSGTLRVKKEGGQTVEKVQFLIGNGETKSWSYPASTRCNNVQVTIPGGNGMVKITVDQAGTAGEKAPRPDRPRGKPPKPSARTH